MSPQTTSAAPATARPAPTRSRPVRPAAPSRRHAPASAFGRSAGDDHRVPLGAQRRGHGANRSTGQRRAGRRAGVDSDAPGAGLRTLRRGQRRSAGSAGTPQWPAAGTSGRPRARRPPPGPGWTHRRTPPAAGRAGQQAGVARGPRPCRFTASAGARRHRRRSGPARRQHPSTAPESRASGASAPARPARSGAAGRARRSARSAGTPVSRSPSPSARSDQQGYGHELSTDGVITSSRTSQPGGWRSANSTASATLAGSLSFASGGGLVLLVPVVEERRAASRPARASSRRPCPAARPRAPG